MPKQFDDEEFERLMNSGELPEIPQPRAQTPAMEDQPVIRESSTGDSSEGAKIDVSELNTISATLKEISGELSQTYNLLKQVMEI